MRRPNSSNFRKMGERIAKEIRKQCNAYGTFAEDEVAWLALLWPIEDACENVRHSLFQTKGKQGNSK